VRAGNGFQTDVHEFQLTPRGTALVTAYVAQPRDLRPFGGSAHGRVLDGVVQEIDIATGLVLFEWHSLDHVPLGDSYMAVPPGSAQWDYFHVNSVDELPDGNFLISSRHTQQLYEVDRRTGAIVWRMGGQHSDFRIGRGAGFAWQHDARSRPDGTITVFDNAAGSRTPNAPKSRALQLRISGRTVELVRSWGHTPGLTASTQGNVQLLPGGDVFVGWGIAGASSEYARDGAVRFDARFASPGDESYRSYKLPWHGRPGGRPRVVANASTAWVSWNGATGVATWRVLGGASPDALRPIASAAWNGLETRIPLPGGQRYVVARAVSAKGKVLGSSAPTAVG
jgi:arylsulfotransferase ASST